MSNIRSLRTTIIIFLLVSQCFASTAQALDDLLQYAFVVSHGASEVAVVDTDTDVVVDRIQLSSIPDEVVLSEKSRKMLSSNLSDRTVTITNLDSLQEDAVIRLDFPPTRMRLGSEGRLLVAGNSEAGVVSIINLGTGQEVRRVKGLDNPDYFIFDREEKRLFVASSNGRSLVVLDIASGEVSERISLVQSNGANNKDVVVTALARTPGGQLGFVLNTGESVMDVIDLRENSRIKRVSLSGSVDRIYPSANNQYLIIPDNDSGDIAVFSTWSMRNLGTVPGAPDVVSVSIALFDSMAFVVSRESKSVIVFDIDERKRLAVIPLPGKPVDSVVSVDGVKIYVATDDPAQLVVINALTLKVVATIDDAGNQPVDVVTVRDLSYCH